MNFQVKPVPFNVFDKEEPILPVIEVEEVPIDEVIEVLGLTPSEPQDWS